jgi:TIGR00370 family protein
MTIQPLGDSAVILDFSDESSDADELLRRVLSVAQALERAGIPEVVEVTSAYQSVAVFLELKRLASTSAGMPLQDAVSDRIATALKTVRRRKTRSRELEIPVCYDEEFAFDLPRVMEHTSLNEAEIIELHARAKYTVACVGFMPGFPFLLGLPSNLRVPRLTTPRTRVPAGSVAIAVGQAGIYPLESPGGWNVIGRTPLRLFNATENPPALLQPGDRIRFRAITRERFDVLAK